MHGWRRRTAAPALVVLALLAGLLSATAPPAAAATDCKPIMLYGVRGSGETADRLGGLGWVVGQYWRDLVSLYPPGTVGFVADDYPAISVPKAFLTGGYGPSVDVGIGRMKADVLRLFNDCRSSVIVAAGYSQGADVIRRALPSLPARPGSIGVRHTTIESVSLFGDPNFIPDEVTPGDIATRKAVLTHGDARPGRQGLFQSATNRLLAGLTAPPGMGGPIGRVDNYCHDGDPVCQNIKTKNYSAHLNYDTSGDTYAAALRTASAIQDDLISIRLKRDVATGYFNAMPPKSLSTGTVLTAAWGLRPSSSVTAQAKRVSVRFNGTERASFTIPAGISAAYYDGPSHDSVLLSGLPSGDGVISLVIDRREVDIRRVEIK